MTARRRALLALAASFSLYAVPLVSAHWADLLAPALAREIFSSRAMEWKATSLATAAGLQSILFSIAWAASARGLGAAIAASVLSLIPLTIAANALYLVVIPARFLIEPDTTPDTAQGSQECEVQGYSLDPVQAGVSRTLELRGEAWVRGDTGAGYGILRVPGCSVDPAAIPEAPVAASLFQALADGSVVYITQDRGSPVPSYWLLLRGARSGQRIEPPAGVSAFDRAPLISEDGKASAWIIRDPDRNPSVVIRFLASGEVFTFTHEWLRKASIVLTELDSARREIVINRDLRTFIRLRLDGTVVWGPIDPPVAAQSGTFRYREGNWLAWDAYVEDSPYRLAWSGGSGGTGHTVPRGSGITSAALDRLARYVAFSTTTGLNIGSIRDKVTVLRAHDGSIVVRKTLPAYSRSQVAFLGDRHFAYTEWREGRGVVHVMRLP